jgi:hypothetical protein
MVIKGTMLLALIALLNGIGAIIVVLIFTLFVVAPQSALDMLFLNPVKKKRILQSAKLLVLLLFIFPFIFFLGEFAKSGDKYKISEKFSSYLNFDYLIDRHSVHLSALASSIEDGSNIANIKIPINEFTYVLKFLIGEHKSKQSEEINSLSKVSLDQVALYEKREREGSSPGLLASFTMILPFPFAILAIFLTTFILVKFLDFILYAQIPFSWIGAFIFAYTILRYFTDSPFDNIVPGPHYFVFLFILLASFRRKNFKY